MYRKSKIEHAQTEETTFKIVASKYFPSCLMSKAWGYIHTKELPTALRSMVYGLWVKLFDCNLNEAIETDLKNYENLNDFFTRRISLAHRPVDESELVKKVSRCLFRLRRQMGLF
jgi:phosphatidylserine decarboxylase